jgi:hypothetical protein
MSKKWLLILFVIAISVFLLIKRFPRPISFINERISSHASSSIVRDILPIGEYASLTYHYTTVAQFKDQTNKKLNTWLGNMEIPLSKRNFLYVYDGVIKLGFQAAKIQVAQSGDEIHLIMPPIEILSHTIDMNTVKSYDIKKGLFTDPLPLESMLSLIEEKKKDMETQIMKTDIIDQAQKSAQTQFAAFLQNLSGIKGKYKIIFSWSDQAIPIQINQNKE